MVAASLLVRESDFCHLLSADLANRDLAWSLAYLFLHLRKSFKSPRHPLTLAMAGGAAGSAILYGTEYFVYQV